MFSAVGVGRLPGWGVVCGGDPTGKLQARDITNNIRPMIQIRFFFIISPRINAQSGSVTRSRCKIQRNKLDIP
jgi:hypothetical protein